MKRFLAAILIVICVIGALAFPGRLIDVRAAGEPVYTARITPASQKVKVNKTAYVTLEVGSTGALLKTYNSFDFTLTYDPDCLTFDEKRCSVPDTEIEVDIDTSKGTIRLIGFGDDLTFEDVFKLAFTVKKTGKTKVSLKKAFVDSWLMADYEDAPEAKLLDTAAVINGQKNSSGTTPTPTPTVTPGHTKTETGTSSGKLQKSKYAVTFVGSGKTAFTGAATAAAGKAYYFYFKPEKGAAYTLTATMGGASVKIEKVGTYARRIDKVTGPLVITAEKSVKDKDGKGGGKAGEGGDGAPVSVEVQIYDYLTLDKGRTVYLLTIKGDPGEDSVFTYGGSPMVYSEIYDAYAWLVISDEGRESFLKEAASGFDTEETEAVIIKSDGDVDASSQTDMADADLIQDLYNARCDDFKTIPMSAFLKADVNASYDLNILDAAAVVSGLETERN